MPSIAQQDYKIIEVISADAPTTKEKAEIRKAVENGIIFDALVKSNRAGGDFISRVLGVNITDTEISLWDAYNGEAVSIDYSE